MPRLEKDTGVLTAALTAQVYVQERWQNEQTSVKEGKGKKEREENKVTGAEKKGT